MSILFCAIFHGVGFGIKKGEFMQNPVNTPQKIGEPILPLLKVQKNTIIIVHFSVCGGSYRGRTDTVSLPVDFESTLSANSNKEPRKLLYQNNTNLLKEKIDY